MRVRGKIQKWGNSLGLRIQKTVAEQLKLREGSEIDITVSGNRLIVTSAAPRYTLEGLIKDVKPENIHDEINTGPAVGMEDW
ncbi:MAG TPA: AbrB/MazE/SpoVT family DNA-binding domain-containing protein [archaeon]|nr:AbrB/MazE/SpoVT family DNA-binding domain-containing protein [archaeon]